MVIYEKVVQEDLDLGYGLVSITNPAGGSLTGTKVGIHSLLGSAFKASQDFAGTDPGAKVAAAIAALPSTGGYVYVARPSETFTTNPLAGGKQHVTLILEPGTYSTSIAWTATADNQRIRGAGITSTILKATGAITIFNGSTYDGIELHDMKIDGNSIATNGVDLGTTAQSKFLHCSNLYITGLASGTALNIRNAVDAYFIRVLCSGGTPQYGLAFAQTDNAFYNCWFSGATVAGTRFTGVAGAAFHTCIWSGNEIDLRVESNLTQSMWEHCYFENSVSGMVSIGGSYAFDWMFLKTFLHTADASDLMDFTNTSSSRVQIIGCTVNATTGSSRITAPTSTTVALEHNGGQAITTTGSGLVTYRDVGSPSSATNYAAATVYTSGTTELTAIGPNAVYVPCPAALKISAFVDISGDTLDDVFDIFIYAGASKIAVARYRVAVATSDRKTLSLFATTAVTADTTVKLTIQRTSGTGIATITDTAGAPHATGLIWELSPDT